MDHFVNESKPCVRHHTLQVKINCRARERKEYSFTVTNRSSRDIEYSVESDLAHVSGPSTLFVPGLSSAEYKLIVSPQLGGTYSGSLTMLAPDKRFQWFAVEIIAATPKPERTLSISTPIRKVFVSSAYYAGLINNAVRLLQSRFLLETHWRSRSCSTFMWTAMGSSGIHPYLSIL
jgi:hypothetical protein